MNNHVSRMDRIAEVLADKVIRWRWLVILVTLVVVMLVAIGAPKLTLSTSYHLKHQKPYQQQVAI